MPKKGKKAEREDDGSLNVEQKGGTWETGKKETLLKTTVLIAQIEEERARQKEKILKDKLQREEKNSAKNLLKINEGWMKILEQAQSAKQKEEISVMRATFEREMEELDSIIEDLERKRQEQQRQSVQVQHDHQQQVERLCELNEKRLTLEHQQWRSLMLHQDRTQKSGNSQKQQVDLDGAMFAMQEEQKKVTAKMQQVYQEALDSYEECFYSQKEAFTAKWHHLEEEKRKHQKATQLQAERLRQHESAAGPKYIRPRRDVKSEQELKVAVQGMKGFMVTKRSEQEQQEQDLIAACDLVRRDTIKLQEQLSKKRAAARKKLTDLTLHSDAASKKLKALIAKGERIVNKGNICEKLENKVLSLLPQEIAALHADTEEAAVEFPELQNLIRRINTAAQQGDALKKRRRDFIRENQELNCQLHQLREDNSPQLCIAPAPTSQALGNTQTGHVVLQGVSIKRPGK